tara:strand:+ start:1118 stop:1561 length:444 start_codon:yes stop_codon:yes gene_type:complete
MLVNSVGMESSAYASNATAKRRKKKERVKVVMLNSQGGAKDRKASLMKVVRGCLNNAVNLLKQGTNLTQLISAGKEELNWIRMFVKPVGNLRLTPLSVSFFFMVTAIVEVINMVTAEGSAVAWNVDSGKEVVISEVTNSHSVNSVKG